MNLGYNRGDILALGDCNTLGVGECLGNTYPERVARRLNLALLNCGHTMATTREGKRLLEDNLSDKHVIILVQFGLVDSYRSLAVLPYVLYYPDNFFRKQARNIVKKIRKMSRGPLGSLLFKQGRITPLDEYRKNIEYIVKRAGNRLVVLLETVPHTEEARNPHIQIYNETLKAICIEKHNCILVKTYDDIYANYRDIFYADNTHLNAIGHEWIAERIEAAILAFQNRASSAECVGSSLKMSPRA